MFELNSRACGRPYRLAVLAILASAAVAAPVLACQNPSFAGPRAAVQTTLPPAADGLEAPAELLPANYTFTDGDAASSIVGMWHAILRLDNKDGPVFDEVLEQFHSDGTELIISNGLPPALGNVCIGVWKRIGGARIYKLRHMTWNWSADQGGFGVPGTLSGHFELEMTLRLDARGKSFSGTWKAENFDTAGNHLPDLDAAGVVNGTRLTVD